MADPSTGPTAQQRERRSWWVGVAVIGVFLLIGVTGLGYGLYRPTPSSADPQENAGPGVVLLTGSFADERNGHLIVAVCEVLGEADTCATELRVTADSGASWTARDLPKVNGAPVGLEAGFALYSLGASRIVVDAPAATAPGYRFYSADGGETWEPRPRKPNGTATTVPENGWVFYPVPDPADRPSGSDTEIAPQVLRPDGTAALLAKGPKYAEPSLSQVTLASDGSIWATAATPPSVSRDRGRTWQRIPMPSVPGVVSSELRTSDGVHTYALVTTNEGIVMQASSDGGKKWSALKPPTARSSDSVNSAPTFAQVPDGALLVQVGSSTFRYEVGETDPGEVRVEGVSFSTIEALHGGVSAIAGGSRAPSFFVSMDGRSWTPITLRAGR
jgi:photosystem II stability/assembly factor-like uncharacterized protein